MVIHLWNKDGKYDDIKVGNTLYMGNTKIGFVAKIEGKDITVHSTIKLMIGNSAEYKD